MCSISQSVISRVAGAVEHHDRVDCRCRLRGLEPSGRCGVRGVAKRQTFEANVLDELTGLGTSPVPR